MLFSCSEKKNQLFLSAILLYLQSIARAAFMSCVGTWASIGKFRLELAEISRTWISLMELTEMGLTYTLNQGKAISNKQCLFLWNTPQATESRRQMWSDINMPVTQVSHNLNSAVLTYHQLNLSHHNYKDSITKS